MIDEREFHITGGGPIATIAHRMPLGRTILAVRHRAVIIALILWLPALLLALKQGLALPGLVRVPFLLDPEVYLRYLLSIPLFVLAEGTVDDACRHAIQQFVTSGLVPEGELPALRGLLDEADRRKSSKVAAVVIAFIAVAPLFYQQEFMLTPEMASTWIADPGGAGYSLAGIWIQFVAQGIARYVIFGWVWRLMIWTMLLGRITMLKMRAMPSHPDRAAGLGFLGVTQSRFAILAVASGIGIMGGIARTIIFYGAKLAPMYISIGLQVLAMALLLLLPLLAVAPRLFRMRREGLFAYGALASHYTQRFDRKWVRETPEPGEDLLGTTDIQSLADMGNSYDLVRQMKVVPIDKPGIMVLVFAAAAPYVPLVLLDPETTALAAAALKRML